MRHRPGKPNKDQEAAFEHPDVIDIVADLVSHPDLRLVKLAAAASLYRNALTPDEFYSLVTPALYNDDQLGDVAQRVATKALQIGGAPSRDDRVRRRGAMLERLVHVLVDARLTGRTFHEREVELMRSPRSRRDWTRMKEVVADGPQFEVYECKADALPDVGDIDELSDIATTAIAEGSDARPTLVVLGTESDLRMKAKAWRLTETLYCVTTDRILSLASSTPTRVLAT